jgi:CubicO group peptidase (beta-lactamase class C family)
VDAIRLVDLATHTSGLAWHLLDRRDAAPIWWHNGGTGGFRSFVGFDPAVGRGVAVLANDTRSVDRIGSVMLERLPAREVHDSRTPSTATQAQMTTTRPRWIDPERAVSRS